MVIMKIIFATVIVACSLLFAAPFADDHYDFRKTSWGMSMAEVRASEASKPATLCYKSPNILVYGGEIEGFDWTIYYEFSKDRLVEVRCACSKKHDDEYEYFTDYDRLTEKMTDEYGKPLEEKMKWDNPEFRDNPKRWPLAVSKGQMSKWTTWETPTTIIKLVMAGSQRRILLNLRYESKALKHLEAEIWQKP